MVEWSPTKKNDLQRKMWRKTASFSVVGHSDRRSESTWDIDLRPTHVTASGKRNYCWKKYRKCVWSYVWTLGQCVPSVIRSNSGHCCQRMKMMLISWKYKKKTNYAWIECPYISSIYFSIQRLSLYYKKKARL